MQAKYNNTTTPPTILVMPFEMLALSEIMCDNKGVLWLVQKPTKLARILINGKAWQMVKVVLMTIGYPASKN